MADGLQIAQENSSFDGLRDTTLGRDKRETLME
jgi:hypothetical protein